MFDKSKQTKEILENTETDLSGRITKLEKSNKRIRLINYVLVITIFFSIIYGFQVQKEIPKVIEAEKFVVKYPNGSQAGYFGIGQSVDPNDIEQMKEMPKLEIQGGQIEIINGKAISHLEPANMILSNNINGDKIISLSALSSDPNIDIKDVNSDNASKIHIKAENVSLMMGPVGGKKVIQYKPRVEISTENSAGKINVYDAAFNLRAALGSIKIFNNNKPQQTPESNLYLFNEKGSVIYNIPR